jgi:hypothetical protein
MLHVSERERGRRKEEIGEARSGNRIYLQTGME